MTTSLYFEAPNDLSVGRVQIQGNGQTIAEWVATPDNRMFQQDDLKPGFYSAEIGPAGVSPQSVVFEIHEGRANNVVLPPFSALSSSGSNTSFYDTDSQKTVAEAPYLANADAGENLDQAAHRTATYSRFARESISDFRQSQAVPISKERRRITIGLSEEKSGRETFDKFCGQPRIELFSGRVEIEIPADPKRDHWAGHRVRLSAAIEKVRIERCLLPLYRGGTRITVTAPPFAPSDLEFGIVPIDPRLRALVRALDAGTSAEVTAVRDDVLDKDDPDSLLSPHADPWAAILVGLLAIRFPEIFQPIDRAWADLLVERAGWAFDTHVIRASQALNAGRGTSSEGQNEAVAEAVAFLARAQVAGSPYYRFTNQLFAEMASGIVEYLRTNRPFVDPVCVKRFEQIYGRWRRELPLQRGAGSMFTWLARDQAALKAHKILTPNRSSSGRLRPRDTLVIFEGQVSAGQVAFIGGTPGALQHLLSEGPLASEVPGHPEDALAWDELSRMPALGRAPGPPTDPNRGRFGGAASRGGFHLTADFASTKRRDRVTINLTVEAERLEQTALADVAWFILHPTFSPAVLKATFRAGRARMSIEAWGGFTVGVWLPKAGVELELDLAKIEGAPRIIRLR